MQRLILNKHEAVTDDIIFINWLVSMPDEKADQLLVEITSYEMSRKLRKKREEGRGGWHGPQCENAVLLDMLKKHVEKGDMIDVINLAAMLMIRKKLYTEIE